MSRIKKIVLTSILVVITTLQLSGCSSILDFDKVKSSGQMMFSYVLGEASKASLGSINFIKNTNYSGEDISNINYTEEKDSDENTIIKSGFTVKNNINLKTEIFISSDISNSSITSNVEAPVTADINDIVNCSLYVFTSEYKNFGNENTKKNEIYLNAITQAINSSGERIEIQAELEGVEQYVQVNNDTINIISNYILSKNNS